MLSVYKGVVSVKKEEVPIWEKYCLSITQASEYFGIGEKKIRQLVQEHSTDGFVLYIGTKAMIKKNRFQAFIDATDSL